MNKFGLLEKLGIEFNTDKASKVCWDNTTYQGHDYLKYYELFLAPMKTQKFTLVELGCFTGASLKM